MSGWVGRRRAASAFAAVVAAIGLIALGPVGPAQADDTIDQITGSGATDSAVTADWRSGLLGTDNKPVAARDPNSPYAFMAGDFQNLSVTVGQTEHLVHQSIKVSWTGGKLTKGQFAADFLQIMECYGDADTGPDPENCEYGSAGLSPGGSGTFIGTRTGAVCTSHTPSTAQPPGAVDGSAPSLGCDPGEPAAGHLDPAHGAADSYSVPFVPVDTTDKIYGPATNYYNRFNSNEVQEANTRPDGTGEVYFQALTGTESSGLGCGELESDGQPRGCWLVIVPRGEYEPNGSPLDDNSTIRPGMIEESPLGAGSWAQRIQVHLNYDPIQPDCPIGSAQRRQTLGTQLVAHAVFSWQLALNAAAKCATQYGYSATPEAASTSEVTNPGGTGLAFTTIPIGSEVIRDGNVPVPPPPMVYAPVAVSALTIGFNINLGSGFVDTPIKLTPRLLAKALTQSYRSDLTDVTNQNPGPDWAAKNPLFMTDDPEFVALNPEVGRRAGGSPLAPLLTADRSGVNQQVWAWILADPTARAWLDGSPDDHGMVVNPNFQKLNLSKAPVDSFPRADPTCHDTGVPGEPEVGRCSLDLLPYVENYDDGASRVRAANNPEGPDWDPLALAPDGTTGWWAAPGTELAGQTLMWGIFDSASLANYGLVPADLCKADGTGCVAPTSASVSTAVTSAQPDHSGLLHTVDPANPGPGGYPLVDVVYAAVRATQDPAALTDYASFIDFAVNQGQVPGVNPGQLPHGYLPLPGNLHSAAMNAVGVLHAVAQATAAPGTPAGNPGNTGGGGGGGGGNGGGGTGGSAGNVPNGGAAPAAVPGGGSALPYSTSAASAVPAASTTPATSVGAVRWALLSVVVAGLAGSIGGPLLRLSFRRWAS